MFRVRVSVWKDGESFNARLICGLYDLFRGRGEMREDLRDVEFVVPVESLVEAGRVVSDVVCTVINVLRSCDLYSTKVVVGDGDCRELLNAIIYWDTPVREAIAKEIIDIVRRTVEKTVPLTVGISIVTITVEKQEQQN